MKSLINQILNDLNEAKSAGYNTNFTFSCTTGNLHNYLTPIRLHENAMITGTVFSDAHAAKEVLLAVESLCDHIFVDVEKKNGFYNQNKVQTSLYDTVLENKTSSKNNVIPFKGNDITCSAAEEYLVAKLQKNSQPTCGVFGLGNIGFKLALKATEFGFKTRVFARNKDERTKLLISALGEIRPKGEMLEIELAENKQEFCRSLDIAFWCNSKTEEVTKRMVTLAQDDCVFVNLGKALYEDGIKLKTENFHWLDISQQLVEMVVSKSRQNPGIKKPFALVGNQVFQDTELFYFHNNEYVPSGAVRAKRFQRYSMREQLDRMTPNNQRGKDN